jgi:bile acid:Na+ symporter, BASS family
VPALISTLTNLFPLWVLAGALLALVQPAWFAWFRPWIVWGLAIIMLGMGLTLSLEQFRQVLRLPRAVLAGLGGQFLIMPLLGWIIALVMQLETTLAVGLILVASCPGGTASNVVAYLARANVALSVLMTMCSTFAAVVLTPLLTKLLAGQRIPVEFWPLFYDTARVILIPVTLGLLLNQFFPRAVRQVVNIAPLISVATIAMICASIIAGNAPVVKQAAATLLIALLTLHCAGFLLGYLFARALRYDQLISRTIAIEVGMQNSGLGSVLAQRNFADPVTALPSAISAVFHSLIGSLLAGYWRVRPATQPLALDNSPLQGTSQHQPERPVNG